MEAFTKNNVPILALNKNIADAPRNNFNFLRLLFAALVLVSHAFEMRDGNRSHELLTRISGTISFGELAVNGFFLLSGYLIVTSWTRKPRLGKYLERRVRRIVPGFLMAFLVSVVVIGPFGAQHLATYFARLNYPLLTKLALQLHPPEVSGIFVGQPYPLLNAAMWSIRYEFRCYLIVALVGLLGASRQKTLWLTIFLVTVGLSLVPDFVNSLAFLRIGHVIGDPVVFVRLFAFFGAGACFSLFQSAIPLQKHVAAVAALAAMGALFSPVLVTLVLATAGTYALFWFVYAKLPAIAVFQRTDDVSYGLYLYGWPIQKVLNWYFPTASLVLLIAAALVICSALGYASWHLIEMPWLQRARRPAVASSVG